MKRRTYPIEPVAKALGITATRGTMIQPRTGRLTDAGAMFCDHIGLNPSRLASILDPRRGDLRFWEADTVAAAIGLHPANLWPEWADDDHGYDE